MLKEFFPSWEAVKRHREVILFTTGLMKDPRPIVQYVYEMQVEDYLNEMRTGDEIPSIDDNLFKSLHAEYTVRLVDDPCHNKYINYYDHYDHDDDDPDTTPVYFPSRLYHFNEMRHEVVLENHLTDSTEIVPCTMYIGDPDEAVGGALLSTCSEVFAHQAVADLSMKFVSCKESTLPAPPMSNPQSVILDQCVLRDEFLMKILYQLCGCGHTLQCLRIYNMDLKPYEALLDELLDDLLGHHGSNREAGLAQRKLMLQLGYNNLSEEFVKKWMNRCRRIDSIDCMIDR